MEPPRKRARLNLPAPRSQENPRVCVRADSAVETPVPREFEEAMRSFDAMQLVRQLRCAELALSVRRVARAYPQVALKEVREVRQCSWVRLHQVPWQHVDRRWRRLYAWACLVEGGDSARHRQYVDAIRHCDMALMLGDTLLFDAAQSLVQHCCALAPALPRWPAWVQLRQRVETTRATVPCHVSPVRLITDLSSLGSTDGVTDGVTESVIKLTRAPQSLSEWHRLFRLERPVVFGAQCALLGHAATRRWSDWDYLRDCLGRRTLPVELGSRYTDAEWRQTLMLGDDFLQHITLDKEPKAYLAQHALFEQVASLKRDFAVPEVCLAAPGPAVAVNAWLGPRNTVSPVHYDARQNLLTQVIGSKYLRLLPPEMSRFLSHGDNTSRVDVFAPSEQRRLKCLDVLLQPGESVYLPPLWWHHVQSLSLSFSVSCWFGRAACERRMHAHLTDREVAS